MPASTDLLDLIRDHGITVLTPLAVIEGPVVSVVAGYLVSLQLVTLRAVLIALVIADVLGDVAVYALGRFGRRVIPFGFLGRFGLTRTRVARMVRGFRARGTRILVVGKLTHAAGFAVMVAAGIVRMSFARFMVVSLLTTIPKTVILVAVGHIFGTAWLADPGWGLPVLALLIAAVALVWTLRRHKPKVMP